MLANTQLLLVGENETLNKYSRTVIYRVLDLIISDCHLTVRASFLPMVSISNISLASTPLYKSHPSHWGQVTGSGFKKVQLFQHLGFSVCFQNPRDLVRGTLPEKSQPCKAPLGLQLNDNFCLILRNRNPHIGRQELTQSLGQFCENVSAPNALPLDSKFACRLPRGFLKTCRGLGATLTN